MYIYIHIEIYFFINTVDNDTILFNSTTRVIIELYFLSQGNYLAMSTIQQWFR